MVAGEVVQHPGGRAAAARDDRAKLDQRAIGRLAAAYALRLQHAEESGGVQVGDRRIRHAAQLFRLRRALAQPRHERERSALQLGEIGRGLVHAGCAPVSADISLGMPSRKVAIMASITMSIFSGTGRP